MAPELPAAPPPPARASVRSRLGALMLGAVAVSSAYAAWHYDLTPLLRAQPAGPRVESPPTPVPPPPLPVTGRVLPVVASETNSFSILSDVSERAVLSVVNISTTRIVRQTLDPDEQLFFRRFHGRGEGDRATHENSLGSGVIVSQDGLILTNNHVIDKASEIRVKLADGREFKGTLVGADPRSDVAVIRLEGKPTGLQVLALADSDRLRLGEVVLAIGSPFGLSQSVSMGIVSAKGRADVHIADYEDFIQTDAAVNPGNSGGALVNLRGELVGINTAIASSTGGSQGIGFAIPSNMARPIMESLLKTGKFTRGWLGVGVQEMDAELRKHFASGIATGGVLLNSVEPGSPAAKAGLQRGDVVTKLADVPMDSARRLRNFVGLRVPGTALTVDLLRDGKALQLPVVLGESPDSGSRAAVSGGLDGLTVAPLDEAVRRRFEVPANVPGGVVVADITPASAAASSGLTPGDVILEVNRRPVQSVGEFQRLLQQTKGPLLLLVFRDGHAFFLSLR
jgi:serine protease Do